MSKDHIELTDHEIDRITYQIPSLSSDERERVRRELKKVRSNGIGRHELRKVLLRLRKSYSISELDVNRIENSLFDE